MKSAGSTFFSFALTIIAFAGCSNGSQSAGSLPNKARPGDISSLATQPRTARIAPIGSALTLQAGFRADIIANVPTARELSAASNGDLLVGTEGTDVVLVPNADSGTLPGVPKTLITLPGSPAAGIALGRHNALYVGTEFAVWKVHYTPGDQSETGAVKIAALRTGSIAPNSDGDVHHTTSVAALWDTLYVSVGSSCNACHEVDPGRAVIMTMGLNGENSRVYAKNMRNAMALVVNPKTYFLWAGGAGQDNLAVGHPYEYFDAVTEQPRGTSWGWPDCEENRIAYTPGTNCSNLVMQHVELPAYSTIIGAAFYPLNPRGAYAFPAGYRGSLFLTAHGSWHTDSSGAAQVGPQVDVVPMSANGWDAATPINWSNPKAQFAPFLSGFQVPGTATFTGRPTGITVGPAGSLFVADDLTGNIYRIRPN